MKLKRHKQFNKDFSKNKLTDEQFSKFILYIGELIKNQSLPIEARDHQLNGEWKSFREFHLGGDMLVIYIIKDNFIWLTRIGTHSQLFK